MFFDLIGNEKALFLITSFSDKFNQLPWHSP